MPNIFFSAFASELGRHSQGEKSADLRPSLATRERAYAWSGGSSPDQFVKQCRSNRRSSSTSQRRAHANEIAALRHGLSLNVSILAFQSWVIVGPSAPKVNRASRALRPPTIPNWSGSRGQGFRDSMNYSLNDTGTNAKLPANLEDAITIGPQLSYPYLHRGFDRAPA